MSDFQTSGIVEAAASGVVDVLGLAVGVERESFSFLEESGVPESMIALHSQRPPWLGWPAGKDY